MIKRSVRRAGRASLKGWWKCLPLLLPPFAVLVFETWLHTQILANQYEAIELKQQIGEIDGRMADLAEERQSLVRMERMHSKAPDLDLVEPDPSQIEVIRAGAWEEQGFELPLVLARRNSAFLGGDAVAAQAASPATTPQDAADSEIDENEPPLEDLTDMD